MPRRCGKTTIISLAVPLKALAYRLKNCILLIGESATTAEANLNTLVTELETNALLLEDFPHLAPGRDARGQLIKWTDAEICVDSGARVVARGMGASMRGLKKGRHRPDLAIVDDPESPESADTFLKRQRHKRWFGGTFLGLGADDWDIYIIGNLIHHDGLLAEHLKSSQWDGLVFKAINQPVPESYPYKLGNTRQDGSALWPEGWPLEALAAYRNEPTVGTLGFAREMMNDPRSDEDKVFFPEQFTYFDFAGTEEALNEYEQLGIFIDPAGGQKQQEFKRGKKDFAAIVTAGRKSGHIDVLDVRLTKKLPDQQIGLLIDAYARFGARIIGAEENIYKNLLAPTIQREAAKLALFPGVRPVTQSENKVSRILNLQPLIEHGVIRFARHLLKTCPEYFGQFDEFPGAVFDDGPDATEGVVRLLEKRVVDMKIS